MSTAGKRAVPATLDDAADLAVRLFHRPEPEELGYRGTRIRDFAWEWDTAERAREFRVVLDALSARLGVPTWYGGSAKGPHIRWRDECHTLVLDGGTLGAVLTVHETGRLERMDAYYFDHGVGDALEQVPSYDALPYLWQLHRHKGGRLVRGCDCVDLVPVMGPVADWTAFAESLTLLLAAWSEQLPATVGDWASFQLFHQVERYRRTIVGFRPGKGLFAQVDDQDGDDTPEHAGVMRALGWQTRARWNWEATFAEPGRASAATLTRLLVADARVRGAKGPADLKVRDVSCGDDGWFLLPALGLERWHWH